MPEDICTEIVDFWLGPCLGGPELAADRRDFWYRGGDVVDREIGARFGAWVEAACRRELMTWEKSAEEALALILLLDQFTRNLYRNTPEAYAGDACAFEAVGRVIESGHDRELHPVSRIWLYHPFHHSEEVTEQDRGLALLADIHDGAPAEWKPYVQRSITGWTRHRNIVAEFGRFPHRNSVLGRDSTEAERAFLADGAESFGQGPRQK